VADRELGQALLTLARNAIGARFGHAPAPHPTPASLAAPGATFVTLLRDGDLRGCVGTLEPRRSLTADVVANALAAAFQDPRFPPLAAHEYPALTVEVSMLSPQEILDVQREADLLNALRPGIDGLVLAYSQHRATFLPQVWEALPDPAQFVAALKHKAGLRTSFWSPDIVVARYTVTKWKERECTEVEVRP
jgi:AmmeMemoRadiSam system protein A